MQRDDVDKPVENPSKLYTAQRRIRHIDAARYRVTEFQLGFGQCIPWHKHTSIHDTFYVLDGVVRVQMREPEETMDIHPGQTFAVEKGRPHYVQSAGADAVSFLLMQGIGDCDFVPLSNSANGK